MIEESDPGETLNALIERFIADAQGELHTRWQAWPRTYQLNHVFEVLGALLARQVTLACQVAGAPQIWEPHCGPIFMRAMADVYITIAWMLVDAEDRARKFIHYGLGQAKLELEHRRAEIAAGRKARQGELDLLEAQERWINGQRLTFLTNVNLGAWSGINTRQMAEEAGCLDFYNYVYVPFSGCAHSMWHHVGVFNLRECRNPLHGVHSVPMLPDFGTMGGEPHTLYLAGKYLDKTCRALDSVYPLPAEPASAFRNLTARLEALYDPVADTDGSDSTHEQ